MDLYAQLTKARQQVAALEKQLAQGSRKLLVLPAKYGFRSMDSFIAALQQAAGGSSTAPKTKVTVAKSTGRKPRAKITAETKAKVKEMVKAEKTGTQIAKALNISLPSVQNIKKELGLVKKRGK
ncbi:MAG: helix-turn-helix domain-containing protein [Candidatus Didemnitutus sp.]|nr:helix-turn-helix domain-containing protein [Candidatus Didemnitutus sp.]